MENFGLKVATSALAALLLIFAVKTGIDMNVGRGSSGPGYELAAAAPAEDEAKPEAGDGEQKPAEGGEKAAEEKPAEGGDKAAEAKPAEGGEKAAEKKPAEGAQKAAEPKAADGAKPAAGEKAAAAAPAEAGGDVVALLAKANADNGKSGFSKCKACHQVEKGKPSSVGPNLWGVVNRPKAAVEGFNYSPAMKAKGGEWTFENLSAFLRNPKAYVPGTKMVFGGVADPQAEADLIAYLATLADTPVPLPK